MTTITVKAPFDGAVIDTLPATDGAGIEAALADAHALYRDRAAWLPRPARIGILKKAAALVVERRERLAVEAAREGGKPYRDSLVEVDRAADGLETCVEVLRGDAGRVVPMGVNAASQGRVAFTQYEPIGVVAAVSAFNHPFNLIAHQVAPAVATGCPVIVKPASATPLSCKRFLDIFYEAGLPEKFARMVLPADTGLATRLVTDPRVAFFSFIGSARVGWDLRAKLAPGARCALEHGGVAPVIVAADADLDDAVPRLAKGGFYHAGQVCVSVQRVFAEKEVARRLAEGIADAARKMVVGDPTRTETDIGPMIAHKECDRVAEWVDEARRAGAGILTGGRKISASCYEPTVIFNPPGDVRVSTEEVFGPVVCVYAVDTLDEGIRRANALPVSFQAAVFTRNLDTAMKCYRGLDGTAVMVNDHTAFRVDWMPFAGARTSGHGTGGMPYTMHDMQIEKMMVWRSDQA